MAAELTFLHINCRKPF